MYHIYYACVKASFFLSLLLLAERTCSNIFISIGWTTSSFHFGNWVEWIIHTSERNNFATRKSKQSWRKKNTPHDDGYQNECVRTAHM